MQGATQRKPQGQGQAAPERAKAPKGKPPGAGRHKPQRKRGAMERLRDLPCAAGVAILVLLLALALPVGNLRALQRATPKAFLRWGDVRSIVEDRIDAAGNAASVAERADIDPALTQAVLEAAAQLEAAKTAREISRADQKLQAAVSALAAAAGDALSGDSAVMLTRVADDFAEQGSFLRQEAREYNKKAEKAEALYEKLIIRALLDAPDVYEGI